jgi:hypothetical protein
LFGLALVIAAATFVIRENNLIQQAINGEPSDIPDLQESAQRGRPM